MATQYYIIGANGYPIISPIALDGFTEYTVGKEPQVLFDAMHILQAELDTAAKDILWEDVNSQWKNLTVTTTSGNKFAANKTAMEYIAFKANNMGDTAVILWVEEWGQFNTDIVELKEALNLAADAHQTIVNSVFGV